MQRILVIQTAFIGDVVLATGLLEKLYQHYPLAEIDILVRKGNQSLFTDHPFIHEVLIWDKSKHKYRALFQILQKIRKHRYDLVVNVQRYLATGILTAFSGAVTSIGFKNNPLSFLFSQAIPHAFTAGQHEVVRNHALISALTDEEPALPKLYPGIADEEAVAAYQHGDYICMAPASVWYTKQFPAERWVALLKQIPQQYQVYLLGAPGDRSLCDTILQQAGREQVTNVAGQLSFLASAALMRKARMNYVNDSAPMHFASSVNAPVTAIYCSTIPGFGYGPLSEKSFMVETNESLACRPCGLHGHRACPQQHFACAHSITNDQLLHSIDAS